MKFKNLKFLLVLFFQTIVFHVMAQNDPFEVGINITGYERSWNKTAIHYTSILKDIDSVAHLGFKHIRLPIDFNYQIEKKSKRKFLKELIKIAKYVKKKEMTLVVSYFDNNISTATKRTDFNNITKHWKVISKTLRKYHNFIFYEILNEPKLYPNQWLKLSEEILLEIRKKDKKTKILIGATNYNSIYELSRITPLKYENLIYVFHFYEPFIFTHQGASWVGNQNKTTNIPYPFDSLKMPKINKSVLGTAGEINFKTYYMMATKKSLQDKITIISKWATKHKVVLWCTEFGAISSINNAYRCNYFKDIRSIFKEKKIKSYLWEYKGNFGIGKIKNTTECFELF